MIAGDFAAYAIGLVTELEFGGHVSLIVFLALYFLFLWIAWILAVRLTKPKHADAGSAPSPCHGEIKCHLLKVGLANACEGQRELCATGWAIFNGDRCRVRISDALDDRKSQSRAPCPPPIAPPE